VATRSGLELALGRTGGTVTAFLEQLVGGPIDVHERSHSMTHASTSNSLGSGRHRTLLHCSHMDYVTWSVRVCSYGTRPRYDALKPGIFRAMSGRLGAFRRTGA